MATIHVGDVFSRKPFDIRVSKADNIALDNADEEEDVKVIDLNTGNRLVIRWSNCGLCESSRCAVVLSRWIKKVKAVKYLPTFAEQLDKEDAKAGATK